MAVWNLGRSKDFRRSARHKVAHFRWTGPCSLLQQPRREHVNNDIEIGGNRKIGTDAYLDRYINSFEERLKARNYTAGTVKTYRVLICFLGRIMAEAARSRLRRRSAAHCQPCGGCDGKQSELGEARTFVRVGRRRAQGGFRRHGERREPNRPPVRRRT